MASKYYLTNGEQTKSVNPAIKDSWDFVEAMATMPQGELNILRARVAAVAAAVNLCASSLANMPFALVDKGGKDYDTSADWQNKVGFWPNPKDQIRRIRLSLITTCMGYLKMGKNLAGIPKQLRYLVPDSIKIVLADDGQLRSLDRYVGGRVEKSYSPDDNELIRFWWLDETTELLPSQNTEFKALMNAAGILYYSDYSPKSSTAAAGSSPSLSP